MNIDKIYKPLKSGAYYTAEPEYFKMFNVVEVRELEEKYKELLEDRITLLKNIKSGLNLDTFKFIYADEINMIERHTGMRWKDIINED